MTQSTLAKCAPKPKAVDRGKALIDAWRQSGLSRAAYARQHHLGAHLLTYWSKSSRIQAWALSSLAPSPRPMQRLPQLTLSNSQSRCRPGPCPWHRPTSRSV